jgi:hypothetical protein
MKIFTISSHFIPLQGGIILPVQNKSRKKGTRSLKIFHFSSGMKLNMPTPHPWGFLP